MKAWKQKKPELEEAGGQTRGETSRGTNTKGGLANCAVAKEAAKEADTAAIE